jgi:hypothetical protein
VENVAISQPISCTKQQLSLSKLSRRFSPDETLLQMGAFADPAEPMIVARGDVGRQDCEPNQKGLTVGKFNAVCPQDHALSAAGCESAVVW